MLFAEESELGEQIVPSNVIRFGLELNQVRGAIVAQWFVKAVKAPFDVLECQGAKPIRPVESLTIKFLRGSCRPVSVHSLIC